MLLISNGIPITEPQPLRTLVNAIIDLMTEPGYVAITPDIAQRLS